MRQVQKVLQNTDKSVNLHYTIGVWRSWLAHLVWDQRVVCSSHITPTL